ncbi:MAG: hypothetical protein HUU29_10160 [Planctomycetaceae bacterium]|nr:hypothetical protein [Planctomycetaceae bacterium]
MNKVAISVAVLGGLWALGAAGESAFPYDNGIVAQKADAKKSPPPKEGEKKSGFKALQAQHLEKYVKELQTYINANAKADDIDQAIFELIEAAAKIESYSAADGAIAAFRKNHASHEKLDDINLAYARLAVKSNDIKKIEAALEALSGHKDIHEVTRLYLMLAVVHAVNMDIVSAKAVQDSIAKLYPAGNIQAAQAVANMKRQLDEVGAFYGDISATDIDGKAIDTKDLRGKVVLFKYWATW